MFTGKSDIVISAGARIGLGLAVLLGANAVGVTRPAFAQQPASDSGAASRPGAKAGPVPSKPNPIAECDRLAAHPDDPGRKAAGVPWEKLDGTQAVAACGRATDQRPNNARLQFQFARALNKIAQYKEAMDWYRKAADQGYAPAETNLGLMYSNGQGTAADPETARKWISRAADKDYAPAQNAMGVIYMSGIGVAKDDGKAADWFRKATKLQYPPAMKNLGILYELGRGVPHDLFEAARLYGEASDHGLDEARARLAHVAFKIGLAYEKGQAVVGDGKPVLPDYERAAKWYRRAADAGNADAQFSMGYLYEQGLGVPRNIVRAYADYLFAERDARDEVREAATLRRKKLLAEMRPVDLFSALEIFDRHEEVSGTD